MKLDELNRLESSASVTPWEPRIYLDELNATVFSCGPPHFVGGKFDPLKANNVLADAKLIAALRNAAPRLIAIAKAGQALYDATSEPKGDSAYAAWFRLGVELAALEAL